MMIFKVIENYADMRFVYDLFRNNKNLDGKNTFESFEGDMTNRLKGYYHQFFVIYDEILKKRVGCIYTTAYRNIDGHCKLTMIIKEEYEGEFHTILRTFIKNIYNYYPIRKLFVETSDIRLKREYCLFGFEQEAQLRNYVFVNGEYADLAILGYEVTKINE